jgi:hypothetical protein
VDFWGKPEEDEASREGSEEEWSGGVEEVGVEKAVGVVVA